MFRQLFCIHALLFSMAFASDLWMPSFFASNMVLQRSPQRAVLHGKAAVNSTVHVTLSRDDMLRGGTSHVQVKADEQGVWVAELDAQQAGGPASIAVQSALTGQLIEFSNVLFGDVIFCSGQSNMQFGINGVLDYDEIRADSGNYPNLRLLQIAQVGKDQPAEDVFPVDPFHWTIGSPDVLGDAPVGNWSDHPWPGSFSAVCYMVGRLVMQRDTKIPVGLISSNVGGTSDLRWSSPDALKVCNVDSNGTDYSTLWNAMVYPFLKVRMAAALWYQGEQDWENPWLYSCSFPEMIRDWRSKFQLADLPFGFVQLAAEPDLDYSWQRLAQAEALNLEKVFMATALDLGDPQSQYGSIHPRDKSEVARRLFLGLVQHLYDSSINFEGPTAKSAVVQGDQAQWNLTVLFSHSEGMRFNGSAFCSSCCNQQSPLETQVGDSWTFVPVDEVAIQKDSLVILGKGPLPTAVRAQWGKYPQCVLYNADGIASPVFTTHTKLVSVQ